MVAPSIVLVFAAAVGFLTWKVNSVELFLDDSNPIANAAVMQEDSEVSEEPEASEPSAPAAEEESFSMDEETDFAEEE
jgi:hypothetical protein